MSESSPSLSAGPAASRAAVVRGVLAGVVVVALFSFFFVYPTHDPEPNGLPVAVGPDGDQIAAVLARANGGKSFDVLRVPDERVARQRILDRDAYAALMPGPRPRVLVSSAASFAAASTLGPLAAHVLPRADVVDVKPLDPDDPRGATLNAATIALTVPGILGAVVLSLLAPGAGPATRVVALAAFAGVGAVVSMLIIAVGIGAIPGPFLGLVGVAALGIFAMGGTAALLIRVVGQPGIALSFLLFLMIGNPASGAASAPELLPDPWSQGGQFLPPGAMATGLRNVAYFDAAKIELWLPVLAVWAIAAAVALMATRRPAPAH